MEKMNDHKLSTYYTSFDIVSIRELNVNDFDSYLPLLLQMEKYFGSDTISPPQEGKFKEYLNKRKENINLHLTIIAIEISTQKIIGTGTFWVEQKFLRNLGKVGHFDDIFVHEDFRNKKVGTKILDTLVRIALNEENCYKIIAGSDDEKCEFFEKVGFKKTSNRMMINNERV